jgi:predicted nucleic acid-binding protein
LIRAEYNASVEGWLAGLQDEAVFLTSITFSELVFGVMRMPDGRRKNSVDDSVSLFVAQFYDRTIDFDADAAIEFGRFVPDRMSTGRPIERNDAEIAACCIAHHATLATRNTKHFEGIPGLDLINPWEIAT